MTEQIIHSLLLALHNIALVGCAAAPFYNRNLVSNRAVYGPKLHYELDKVVEDTLQGNAPFCMGFVVLLLVTGLGMPMNHFFFHRAFRKLGSVALVALAVKLICFTGMLLIAGTIFFSINPKLKEIFGGFAPGTPPGSAEAEFFTLRAKRKSLCEICLWLALGILVSSAFLGFAV